MEKVTLYTCICGKGWGRWHDVDALEKLLLSVSVKVIINKIPIMFFSVKVYIYIIFSFVRQKWQSKLCGF